jgi:predicted nucleic acid-binding protein
MKTAATKRFVLDASVAAAWCFEDESTTFTEAVLDLLATGGEAVVPAIWPLEIANAVLVAERRKRLTLAQGTGQLRRIARLPISVMPIEPAYAFEQVVPVARQEALSVYDAAYLQLALREALPMATLDSKLKQAAKVNGVILLS